MNTLILRGTLASTLLLSTAGAFAQETDTLDTVVVTASRIAQTADETLAPVTVITRDDIERYQATSVQDVLRRVPGAYFSNNGGSGKATSLFLRGSESDHVVVLIDGVKVGSATTGSTTYQHLPISQIERIEVVRGPRSSLYGSEAIGGVIQIFTRNAANGAPKPYASISAARYGQYQANIGFGGREGDSWYNVNVAGEETNGFNSCRSTGGSGCFPDTGGEPDKDGYKNLSGSLRIGRQFGNIVKAEANLLHADNEVEFDGGFQNESEGLTQTLSGSVEITPNTANKTTIRVARSRDEVTSYKNGTQSGQFNTKSYQTSLQHDVSIGDHVIVTAGADYEDDQVSTSAYGNLSRYDRAVFAQVVTNISIVDAQLSLRNNDNEQFGSTNTGNLAFGIQIANNHRITASTGRAFKAPTFNELFFPFFGDPSIRPERSRNYEVGYNLNMGQTSLQLSAFHNKVEDLIAFDSTTFLANNINQARIRGAELSATSTWANYVFNLSVSRVKAIDESGGANHGNELARRARYFGNIDIDRSFGSYSIGASLQSVSRRYDDGGNATRLGSYGLVDLRGSMSLNSNWSVDARLSNIGDKDYETAAFYNQPGRSLHVTLRYQPQ